MAEVAGVVVIAAGTCGATISDVRGDPRHPGMVRAADDDPGSAGRQDDAVRARAPGC